MKFWIAISVLLGVSFCSLAQNEGDTLRYRIDARVGSDTLSYPIPDIHTWRPDDVTIAPSETLPRVSMTSYMQGLRRELPSRVFIVLPNNTLEAWGRINVSNGQAWNWGPLPGSLLDARTLSFPAPR